MTTTLPTPGSNNVDDHVTVGHRFIAHARDELERGNRLQASEKVWGATAHALKAIGMQRGWRHRHHGQLTAISEQIAKEFDRPDFHRSMDVATAHHINFYENQRSEEAISTAIDDIEQFVTELDRVRSSPPRPVTVETQADQDRLENLTGRRYAIGLPLRRRIRSHPAQPPTAWQPTARPTRDWTQGQRRHE